MSEFTQDSWKMYRYTVEERIFIVRTFWKTESIKSCQQTFLEKFGGRHPPSKSSIWALSKKPETKGTLLDEHTGGRPKMSEEKINWQRTFQNMERRVQSCLNANGGPFQHMLWCRHIPHTTNVLLFKFRCNIFIGVRIIKEIPGSVANGSPCIILY